MTACRVIALTIIVGAFVIGGLGMLLPSGLNFSESFGCAAFGLLLGALIFGDGRR